MADEGRALTDKIQAKMERAITREYRQAHKEVQAKLDEYLARFEREDKRYSMEVKAGRMTMKDYQDWRVRHIGMGQRWEELRDTLAEDLHNTNQIAMSIAKGYMPEVYALNYNYGTFAVERQGHLDTSFTLIDHNFVERLVRDNPKLLPDPTPGSPAAIRIARNKDVRWNRNKLQSAIIQGCLQGESIGKIANRFQRVTDMNRTQALRHARTAVNGAANGGRHDAYVRASRMGIDLVEEWSAILDGHTRDSHADMDGERKEVDQPTFSNGCRFPGDPFGRPAEVYNCRCDLLSWVKGFEPSESVRERHQGTGNYGEWERSHRNLGAGLGNPDAESNTRTWSVGKIDFADKNAIERRIKLFEDAHRNAAVEYAMVITNSGNVYVCRGLVDGVNLDGIKESLAGAYITHNHPESVTLFSFGAEDRQFFNNSNVAVLRGFDVKYTYEMNRSGQVGDAVSALDVFMRPDLAEHDATMRYSSRNGLGYWRREL